MRRPHRLIVMSILVCLLIVVSGCVIKDSPAPGCVETIGFPSMGGCFGKTAIINLQVESTPGCVQIDANNCNGGVLDLRNNCAETIQLGDIQILPSDDAILDIVETGGKLEIVKVSSNFSQYKPVADREIRLEGVVGDQTFRLTFTKTGPLCE